MCGLQVYRLIYIVNLLMEASLLALAKSIFYTCITTVFFRQEKVAIIKTKSATIALFSSTPFLLVILSFSPFLFLRYCDFGASRA